MSHKNPSQGDHRRSRSHRGCDDKFAAAGLLVAGRQRMLAQKIEFNSLRLPFNPSSSRSLPDAAHRPPPGRPARYRRHGTALLAACRSRCCRQIATPPCRNRPTLQRQTSATIRSKPARVPSAVKSTCGAVVMHELLLRIRSNIDQESSSQRSDTRPERLQRKTSAIFLSITS